MRALWIPALLLVLQEPPGWRRLEQTLRPPAQKQIEITSWPEMLPLSELSSPEAPKLLEKFSEKPDELGLSTPVERALFQRLLWAFFDGQHRSWTRVDPDLVRLQKWLTGPPKQPKPDRLFLPAARLIRRLALSEEEIRALPDPYARTVESGTYAAEFDATKPAQPFLPPDLWKADGPWISLGNSTEQPLAVRHTAYFGGRSSFQIFLRVPEGRSAGLDLLKLLRSYRGESPYQPPKIPAMTQLVIVEQPLLINAANKLILSPLVETVEIRVVRQPEIRFRFDNTAHAVFRFRLRPDLLAAQDPSPLRARGTGEEDWEPISLLVESGRAGPWSTRSASLFLCTNCHGIQANSLGIFEFRSIQKDAGTVEVVAPEKERERALRWKENEAAWKELQSYWK